ncbi:hypothetical protein JHK86_036718 [Glycine max]|nr:hypothetical protein JHK86_036718 [Glycine max]
MEQKLVSEPLITAKNVAILTKVRCNASIGEAMNSALYFQTEFGNTPYKFNDVIVSPIFTVAVEDRFCIYLEYVHPVSINNYVRNHCGAATESVIRNFTRHILSGWKYCEIAIVSLIEEKLGQVALFNVEKALHAFTYASSTRTTLASSQGLFRRNSVCIEEVRSTYHTMVEQGTGPTTGVWVALLNACSLNQDVERGELAAKHVLQLEPYKASNIVLVSNFYAATDRWDWVDELRSIMRTKGLVKEVGNSWINVLGFN